MRFYDDVIRNAYVPPQLKDGLAQCKVISIDNVVDYLIDTEKMVYARDLPNMVLPFDHCFLDVTGHRRTRAWFQNDTIARAGFFLWNCHDPACIAREQSQLNTPIRWSVHGMLLFLCTRCDMIHIPDITWTLNLDEFGRWANLEPPYYTYQRNPFANTPPTDDAEGYFSASEKILPSLFALALMHAKNTSLNESTPSAGQSRKYQRKFKRPLTPFHTISVQSMQHASVENLGEKNSTISSRLHIVRGHWKDYRFGKGLFGKYKDIFWWDAQMRGNADVGVVASDYDVQAPDET